MAYDIPPQLQHKEKIMFDLTFQQLGYAAPALLLSFIVLKLGMNNYVAGTIITLIVASASFLMFFDGKYRIKGWIDHFLNRHAEVDSEEMRKIINITKIGDTIETSNKELAVLEVIPMNFMIKTEEEKESITTGFQKFLNSLDYPIQIHISSHPISLRGHLKHTHKKISEKLTKLFDSYCQFIKEKISENNVKNRRFYIIIPKKDDLNIQTKVCEEKLKSIGLKVKRLKEKQLLRMLHNYIGGNESKNMHEGEIKEAAHSLIAPNSVIFQPENFKSNKKYCKVLAVKGYPQSVEMGFLDKMISSGDDYDISIHVDPYPIDTTMVSLNRELQKQNSDLYADSKRGILNPSLEIKFKSTRNVLENLQKGQEKLFNVSLYAMCKGKTEEEAELLARKVKADLNGLMIQSKTPNYRMKAAYESMLPLGKDTLDIKRNIHTTGLSAFFPFSSPFLDMDEKGVLIGLNKNKIPIIKNIFGMANANGVILATSGSGKSYFTKLLLSRQFMNGCDVIIIDPQGEYLGITQQYKGEIITISRKSETIINPLDLMGHEYLEKRLSLMDLFHIMFGELNELQKSILDKAVDLTYERKGITRDDWETASAPRMSDLHKTLVDLERNAVQQEKVTYRALLNRIQMYTEKGAFGFLDRETKINFDNKFVCFNIGSLPKQVKPVLIYLILDYVYMKMKESLNRKLLVIDEAWSMLQTAEECSYVFEIVKTCRKFNMGLLMITQDVADLVNSKAGHAVLANSSYTFLLRQKPVVIHNVAKTFYLSQMEKDFLVTAKLGTGILIMENDHQEVEVIASEEEHSLITTNPDEMVKLSEKKKPSEDTSKEKIDIGLDINKTVHPGWNLSLVEENFLINQGYKRGRFHGIGSGPRIYYVKEKSPESLQHTFLVVMIEQEIRKYTDKVAIYQTAKPDIIFTNQFGKRIALEIETGKEYKKHKKRINEKFEKIAAEWRHRAFIVITDKDLRNSYARFGLDILLRKDIPKFVRLQFKGKKKLHSGGQNNRTKLELRE
ncbi:VirB4-like conjugal transfer ATPase, CD1110 family [Nanoarchaeota archaeon]